MNINEATPLLGGLSATQFMQLHWQKKPLLVRSAVDARQYPLTVKALFSYAKRDDMQSRYISCERKKWILRQGPFESRASLPADKGNPWTVLVQGMNHQDAAMHALMQRFRFVPDARLDDVMVSYATPGGGVGPHVDSYDVFLLQLKGTRRWSIGPLKTASSRELIAGAPIKLLKNFKPTAVYDLVPGDMLYLPPGYGHDGVAVDECLTASIGFRAPRAGELAASLLEQLADVLREADEGSFAKLYEDAAQAATDKPAQLPAKLSDFLQTAWQQVKPSKQDFEQIVGQYQSEPKAHVMFMPNKTTWCKAQALQLAPASILLYGKHAFFINGEVVIFDELDAASRAWLRQFADTRCADIAMMHKLPSDAADVLAQWWQAGYILSGEENE